ncbi:glycoside hydrolase family 57 protein [Cerasicoccus frondis]|uniref:glycoside hydrolase family 57 protein n=1 Tax=Cerasicoccus frondis TaxID=490090 RepID=UPI00285269BC|nr:1,4-alpha-glucan branching protein domain-containing protein [Cerasicoccus frondis]
MAKGYLSFVLHAHLPFVRHPEFEQFLEELWLFEAITETYIPLLQNFDALERDGVPWGLTISISPSLLAMLEDELLRARYARRMKILIELCEREQERLKHDPHFSYLAKWYHDYFSRTLKYFEDCDGRISQRFRALHEKGNLEVISCIGTHGFMPHLSANPATMEGQLLNGFAYFEEVMGFQPNGCWVPECAYYPGLDDRLRAHGIRFFCTETEGIEYSKPQPVYGVHAPLYTPSGVAAFGRDHGCTKQVWSAEAGFPGDGNYREFYRDIGHELDFDYLRKFLPGDVRSDTGIKYHRITGPGSYKAGYDPESARKKADQHAAQFLFQRVSHIDYLDSVMNTSPVIVAPFDAELFGHWWFEGPTWLDYVLRKAAYDQSSLETISLGKYLDRNPVHQTAYPATSSWGHKGHFEYWLNGANDWMFDQITSAGDRMTRLARDFAAKKTVKKLNDRALQQCARELVLAQSSDWPFIVSNGTSAQYAERRVRDHCSRLHYLANALEHDTVDKKELESLELMDNIFPNINWRVYAG